MPDRERDVRLLRAMGHKLEHQAAEQDNVAQLAADVALLAMILADYIEGGDYD